MKLKTALTNGAIIERTVEISRNLRNYRIGRFIRELRKKFTNAGDAERALDRATATVILSDAGDLRFAYPGLPLWLEWEKRCRIERAFENPRVWRLSRTKSYLITTENNTHHSISTACCYAGWQWHDFRRELILVNPGEHGVDATTFDEIVRRIQKALPT